ncbi:MAG: 50S ribosomal protein L4 [Candidatus Nanohaloarchaea archaeon]|nr:50S ribosomal protein L4 [Candidatus Nanohaloarchaea archaeon]
MMVDVQGTDGTAAGEIELPLQFQERVRPDIIKKAVLAAQSNRRQPYGADEESGMKHVTHWKKRSRAYRGIRGRSYPSSRTPRKITFRRGMQMSGPGGEAPQAVGGRKAHPPKADRDFSKDINEKERRKAIRSAIAATMDKDAVRERGHAVDDVDLPLVVDASLEQLEKTSEVETVLQQLGLSDELDRVRTPSPRAGRGTSRGRPTRSRAGPLLVVGEDQGIARAARNIPGVQVCTVEQLNAEVLAPGTDPGRLVVWTETAIQRLDEEGLFR